MDRCSRWGKQERDRVEIFLGSHHFLLIMKYTPPPLVLLASAVLSIHKTKKLSDGVSAVSGTEVVSHVSDKQSRDLHSRGSTAGPTGPNATGCGAGQLLMSECGCGREESCVCAGCGRIQLFAELPQIRNYLHITFLKHINCYLLHKSKSNN